MTALQLTLLTALAFELGLGAALALSLEAGSELLA